MKKLIFAIFALLMASVAYAKDAEFAVAYEELPEKAQKFVTDNYEGAVIKKTIQKFDDGVSEYKIYFKDKTVIEFDVTGAWSEISVSKKSVIPATLLPGRIQEVLSSSYADKKIIKVENDGYKYEIKFSDGTELEVNANGKVYEVSKD